MCRSTMTVATGFGTWFDQRYAADREVGFGTADWAPKMAYPVEPTSYWSGCLAYGENEQTSKEWCTSTSKVYGYSVVSQSNINQKFHFRRK